MMINSRDELKNKEKEEKRKKFIVILLICAYFVVAVPAVYWKDLQEKHNKENEVSDEEDLSEKNSQEEQTSHLLKNTLINFQGIKAVGDNPWGVSAGVIENEEEGKCIFLTPGTEVKIERVITEEDEPLFSYTIFPSVREASDGMRMSVRVTDKGSRVLFDKEVEVFSEKDWEKLFVDFSLDESAELTVEIACDSGENEEESGDWLILK